MIESDCRTCLFYDNCRYRRMCDNYYPIGDEAEDEYIEEHFPESDMLFGADSLSDGDVAAPEYFYSLLGGTGTYPITIIVNEDGEIFTLKTTELNYNSLKFLVEGALASND